MSGREVLLTGGGDGHAPRPASPSKPPQASLSPVSVCTRTSSSSTGSTTDNSSSSRSVVPADCSHAVTIRAFLMLLLLVSNPLTQTVSVIPKSPTALAASVTHYQQASTTSHHLRLGSNNTAIQPLKLIIGHDH